MRISLITRLYGTANESLTRRLLFCSGADNTTVSQARSRYPSLCSANAELARLPMTTRCPRARCFGLPRAGTEAQIGFGAAELVLAVAVALAMTGRSD
ncbi:MAG: hypothetical protein ACRETP_03905, partial [Steroidobacteraceae bacterium]